MSSRTLRRVLSIVILIALLIPPVPVGAAEPDVSPPESAAEQEPSAQASAVDRPASPPPGCFWADLNCDHLVDVFDFIAIAQGWNCSLGDGCFVPEYDVDGDDRVGVSDIMKVTAEFDPDPPQLAVSTPADGQIIGGTVAHVSGTVSDSHPVTVTINFESVIVAAGQFAVDLTLDPGNQVITVVATDAVGATATETRLVAMDAVGPQIEVFEPQNRQAVYTTTPAIDIRYDDYDSQVDTASLSILLQPFGGSPSNITGALTVEPDRAYGTVPTPLEQDTSYTMTVTLQDTLDNETVLATVFYVPPDPANIEPLAEPQDAGYVSGVIYNSTSCDQYLTTCQGLPGVQVTLERVDTTALARERAARNALIDAKFAAEGRDYRLPAPTAPLTVTLPVSGTVVTGPDGFFSFPADQTAYYWLRAEKNGFTYGQREAAIVKERSTATNSIYLTPIDPVVTPCGSDGCSHTSGDGQMQVQIPAGAIPTGDQVQVTATDFDQVEFLPSGELPEGTWETYAFNLGGDSDYSFQQPITVRLRNSKGFAPGSEIPLGFWNQHLMQWEHEGVAMVETSGQWVEMQLLHFSNHDPNYPVDVGELHAEIKVKTKQIDSCEDTMAPDCEVGSKSGRIGEQVQIPPTNTSGGPKGLDFIYDSGRAYPTIVFDIELTLNPDPGVTVGNYVQFTLFVEGSATATYTFEANLTSSNTGRYRYLWEAIDDNGNPKQSGSYKYEVKLDIPYRAQYCGVANGQFGGPPDCINLPTGRYVDATQTAGAMDDVTIASSSQNMPGSPRSNTSGANGLGVGWALDGLQRLYEDEAGRILIADGRRLDEYYFPNKDLLNSGANAAGIHASVPAYIDDNSIAVPPFLASPAAVPEPSRSVEALAPVPVEDLPHLAAGMAQGTPIAQTDPPTLTLPSEPLLALQPPVLEAVPSYSETSLESGTEVCGQIITNTIWTAAASPYVVTCDVQVTTAITLTIEPSVTVQFQHTADDLLVSGRLTPLAPLQIRSDSNLSAAFLQEVGAKLPSCQAVQASSTIRFWNTAVPYCTLPRIRYRY